MGSGPEDWVATIPYNIEQNNTSTPVDILVTITIINHNTQDPKDTYSDMLTDEEIAIYSGHARYGTGPDFDGGDSDSASSVSENFIIGVNSALHQTGKLTGGYNAKMNGYLQGQANDLETIDASGRV